MYLEHRSQSVPEERPDEIKTIRFDARWRDVLYVELLWIGLVLGALVLLEVLTLF